MMFRWRKILTVAAIAAVAFKGEYLDRQALDAMLADVRAHVAEREAGEE